MRGRHATHTERNSMFGHVVNTIDIKELQVEFDRHQMRCRGSAYNSSLAHVFAMEGLCADLARKSEIRTAYLGL
jgi:hypothetical protein